MAQDTLTYVLEDIYAGVFGIDLIEVYTDLFGYEVDIFTKRDTIYEDVYGTRAGAGKGFTHYEQRQLLIGHSEYGFTGFTDKDISDYKYLDAYPRIDDTLPLNGVMTINRLDDKVLTFRIEHVEQIGSTTAILHRYRLAFIENIVEGLFK